MWFASIWVFTLGLPWQLGADLFYRHLIDGDPASNTLSWRWVCGLHTRGKTYLARVSNILNYTDNRFSPHGQLAISAPPLSEARVFPIRNLPTTQALQPERALRSVDHGRGLLPRFPAGRSGTRHDLGRIGYEDAIAAARRTAA